LKIDMNIFYILHGINRVVSRFIERVLSSIRVTQFAKCGANGKIGRPLSIIGGKYIFVGDNFSVGDFARIEVFDYHNGVRFQPRVEIGDNVSINNNLHLGCINRIVIEDNVLIASDVYISDHAHGRRDYRDICQPPSERIIQSKGPVYIQNNSWVGEKVTILPGVTIGKYAIVGAGSVLTKDVPDFCIVSGNPARIIRRITEDLESI